MSKQSLGVVKRADVQASRQRCDGCGGVECEMHKVMLALAAGAETGETPALRKRPLG